MKLVEFVPPVRHPLWKLCLQMGITDVIVKVNPALTGLSDPWKYETLKTIVEGLKDEGLTVVGLEGDSFDMSPIKEFGARNGQDARCPGNCDGRDARCPGESGPTGVSPVGDESVLREEALDHYRELLESMSRLGIKLLCYNFMVGPGWSRTGVRPVRGGALATYFNKAEYEAKFRAATPGQRASCPLRTTDVPNGQDARWPGNPNGQDARWLGGEENNELILDKDQVWANYEYFIKSVMPTAERCGVRMGLHPDDPCLPSLGGYARIFETVADYDRAYAIYPCESNAVTFCQANFKLMITPCRNWRDARCPVDRDGRDARCPGDRDGRDARCPVDRDGRDARCPGGRDWQDARCPGESGSTGVPPVDLAEVARHFGKRIAFIHIRDVEGDKYDFTELFHDQGSTDQFALMRTYREIGLDVPVRGDHVPEMEGDRKLVEDAVPGYFNLGRLFANGYLKALLKGTCEGQA